MTEKTTAEKLNSLSYANLKAVASNICKNGEKQPAGNFVPLFSELKRGAVLAKAMPDRIHSLFAVFNTSDRGAVLVIFDAYFLTDQEEGLMRVNASFVEKPSSYRCPQAVLDAITDENATAYKQEVEKQFPLAEQQRILAAFAEKRKSATVTFTDEELAIILEGSIEL